MARSKLLRHRREEDVPPSGSTAAAAAAKAPPIAKWEEISCPICMDTPHNAVLIHCSSHDQGCRPFMCDTSERHSNCLDQYRKAQLLANANGGGSGGLPAVVHSDGGDRRWVGSDGESDSSPPQQLLSGLAIAAEAVPLLAPSETADDIKKDSRGLCCPLCRGRVLGWRVVDEVRVFLNNKARACASERCDFSGAYAELRRHARVAHPKVRPAAVDPTREREWHRFERQRDMGDVLSTIRAAMPGATVLGDYVIEDGDDDHDGGGSSDGGGDELADFPGDDGNWWTVYLLFQVFGPQSLGGGNGGSGRGLLGRHPFPRHRRMLAAAPPRLAIPRRAASPSQGQSPQRVAAAVRSRLWGDMGGGGRGQSAWEEEEDRPPGLRRRRERQLAQRLQDGFTFYSSELANATAAADREVTPSGANDSGGNDNNGGGGAGSGTDRTTRSRGPRRDFIMAPRRWRFIDNLVPRSQRDLVREGRRASSAEATMQHTANPNNDEASGSGVSSTVALLEHAAGVEDAAEQPAAIEGSQPARWRTTHNFSRSGSTARTSLVLGRRLRSNEMGDDNAEATGGHGDAEVMSNRWARRSRQSSNDSGQTAADIWDS